MQIGFNFTMGATIPIVRQLYRERHIDYCELLTDNFLHVDPDAIARAFDCPVAFHIMLSRFLENDRNFLSGFAAQIRRYAAVLRPLYVSDHLARFTHKGRQLYNLAELDYRDADWIIPKVAWWQEELGCRLYLENFPSIMDDGLDAPTFFARMTEKTGVGLLFDVSNAVCAQRNCGADLDAWAALGSTTNHFHVAGFGPSLCDPRVTLDTHDRAMADDTRAFLRQCGVAFDKPGATITYERDADIEFEPIATEVQVLRGMFAKEGLAA